MTLILGMNYSNQTLLSKRLQKAFCPNPLSTLTLEEFCTNQVGQTGFCQNTSCANTLPKDRPAKLIFLCDCDQTITFCKTFYPDIPIIAFSHSDNSDQSLLGTSWMIIDEDAITLDYLEEVYCHFHGLPLTIAQTDRCLIRELTREDLPSLLELQAENVSNPDGCFFPANTELNQSCQDTFVFLENYIKHQYPFFGYGIFAITDKTTGGFLGIAGFSDQETSSSTSNLVEYILQPSEGECSTEAEKEDPTPFVQNPPLVGYISYSFLKRWQGQGYASEAVKSLLSVGFDMYGFTSIIAQIHSDNTASLHFIEQFSSDSQHSPACLL